MTMMLKLSPFWFLQPIDESAQSQQAWHWLQISKYRYDESLNCHVIDCPDHSILTSDFLLYLSSKCVQIKCEILSMVSDVQFQCSSGFESIFTDTTRNTYIFQMIAFNVILNVWTQPLLSTHFAQMCSLFSIWNKILSEFHQWLHLFL